MNDLRDELSEFARHIDVPTGSAADAMARAKRRSQMTVVTRVGAAVLLVGAGVVGVNQLSAPGLEGDPIEAPNNVANSATPVTDADGHTLPPSASTVPVTVAGSANGQGSVDDDGLAGAPQTRPAEYMDLDYSWVAYPADSPEALALKFNPNEQYAVGTTDGPDGYPVAALYSQTDTGWQPIETVESYSVEVVGDTLYAVADNDNGTDAAPTQTLRAYDIPSDTWSDVALPEGSTATLPSGSDSLIASDNITIAASNDALLAVVSTYFELDQEQLNLDGSSGVSVDVSPGSDTQILVTDYDCVDRVNSELDPTENSVPSTGPLDDPFAECDTRVDPEEFGITPDELAVANTVTNTYWRVSGGTWQQLQLPGDDSTEANIYPGGIVETFSSADAEAGNGAGSRLYTMDANGSFKPLYDGRTFVGLSASPSRERGQSTQRALAASNSYLLSQDLTATEWTATDLNALGDGPGWGTYNVYPNQIIETADGGVLALATVAANLPTESTELTSGDYTIRWDVGSDGVMVTNDATGEEPGNWFVATESGQVELRSYDDQGNETTLATFDTAWTDVPALNVLPVTAILASPDGVRFGAIDSESLKELIDGGPDEDVAVNGIYDHDGQIVVTGSLVNAVEEIDGPAYVFVGTPN